MKDQMLPIERRLKIVSETIRLIDKGFIHWEDALIKPEDLDQTADAFLEKAAAAETRAEFGLVMRQLFGQLRNSHSKYADRLIQEPANGYLGFTLWDVGGEQLVNLDATGVLLKGDVILSIGGKSPAEWYKELEPYIGAAGSPSLQMSAQYLLPSFVPGMTVEIEYEDQNRTLHTVSLPRILDGDQMQQAFHMHAFTEGKWLQDGKTAYIKIPSFNDPRYEEHALELVGEYLQASSLVIDVRGNGGGSTPGRLIRRLMDRPYRWWMERARHPEWLRKRHGNGGLTFADDYRYAEWHPAWTAPDEDGLYYRGRIILLADRYVGSAAEDFIMPFKDNDRATIVGETTFGSTGQPMFRQFGDDIRIGVGSIRAFLPNGDPFEGLGISPDIEVRYTRDDLYRSRDAALKKAVELLE